jgi:leader peptidase (prepilin peptidase)/N-methyltransferase
VKLRKPSVRDTLIVLTGVVVAIGVVLVKHGVHDIALGLALVVVLVPVTISDLDSRIIPNRITGPAALAALAIGLATRLSAVPGQLIGGAAAGGFLLLFALAYRRGLGMGDVKLGGVLGLYLSASVAVAMVVAICSSAILGVVVIARVGFSKGRKTAFPFGPFLALGGVVGVLAGPPIVHWYVHSLH